MSFDNGSSGRRRRTLRSNERVAEIARGRGDHRRSRCLQIVEASYQADRHGWEAFASTIVTTSSLSWWTLI